MTMRPERCAAVMRTMPSAGLPAARRTSGRFDSMIDGVADHVRQRFGQALDDRLVDLGRLAFRFQADLLAGRVRYLANHARHALEHRLHRLGADRHHAFLDLARQLLELLEADHDRGRAAKFASITRCDSIA